MNYWLKPWGTKDLPFKDVPRGVITFPKHPGRPRVSIGDLLVIYGVGTGKLVAVMRAKSEAYQRPDSGPGGKNERYPFACDGEVQDGLDLSGRLADAPPIGLLPEQKRGAIQYGGGHQRLSPEEFETVRAAIQAAVDSNRV